MKELWRRLLFLSRRRQLERELAEEMRQHLELRTQKNILAGMLPEEARHAAQRQLGNVLKLEEESRQSWGFPLLESFVQDTRYALRGLGNAKPFAAIAVITLALGIGATTTIFSVVNAILLRPLPYAGAARLVHVWATFSDVPGFRMSQSSSDIPEIRAGVQSLEGLASYGIEQVVLTGKRDPEQLRSAAVSPELMPLLGQNASLGRTINDEDTRGGNGFVTVLSYGLWKRRFGGDPEVIGRQINLNQKAYTVIGVMPAGFGFPDDTQIWTPVPSSVQDEKSRYRSQFVVAKLKPGASLQQANAELSVVAKRVAKNHPDDTAERKMEAIALQQEVTAGPKSLLLILLGAVGLVLLMACVNVSNLVLSRGLQRRREIATRMALGASRGRIVRQLLAESLLLAFSGGLLGLLLAVWGVRLFRTLAPAGLARIGELRADYWLVLGAIAVSALAGILSGVAPAFHSARADLNLALKEKQASADERSPLSPRNLLIVSEIALALVLLTGSGLMMQSLFRLLHVETGIRTDHILTMDLALSGARYGADGSVPAFARQLLDSLRSRPGIEDVAFSDSTMFRSSLNVAPVSIPGAVSANKPDDYMGVMTQEKSVSPSYFHALGMRLVKGRYFSDHENTGAWPRDRQRSFFTALPARAVASGQKRVAGREQVSDCGRCCRYSRLRIKHGAQTAGLCRLFLAGKNIRCRRCGFEFSYIPSDSSNSLRTHGRGR